MPRIVPIQLLKCLKVLLDDNGGILSAGEVKRLASLMTKYSKKLVSKCIYVQILKCTKTELLGEFMGAGGWSLVYTWLNDAIRAMNWPLVQEILELLLLCPVDVNRLKINSAPKLVKGLCKDGGNEGVRILAKRLVEQWLKVVTENPEATLQNSTTTPTTTTMTPQATAIKVPPVAVVAPMVTPVNIPHASQVNTTNHMSSPVQHQQSLKQIKQEPQVESAIKPIEIDDDDEEEAEEEEEEDEEPEDTEERECQDDEEDEEQDPLGDVQEPVVGSYSLTPAQKKATESGLVYKIVVKNGNQVLAKVSKTNVAASPASEPSKSEPEADPTSDKDEDDEVQTNEVTQENEPEGEEADVTDVVDDSKSNEVEEVDENSSSLDKPEKENDSNSGNEDDLKVKTKLDDSKKVDEKKSLVEDRDKDKTTNSSSKDGKSSKDKERRTSSSSLDKEKDRDSKSSKSSSSSSHRSSSSGHKSSSSKSSSSSSSSKSKSSSSSSRRSSSDKHKSDKDRSSSSKDKDRSSSSSKHRSSSSSKSSSSSSKDKYRDKEKSSSGSSSSSSKNRDKDRDSSSQSSDKDKNNTSSSSSSSSADKLAKMSKKSKEDTHDESASKPTSITIPSKKASMSIEIRKDVEKSKTVKTYKSQFRSHGLNEEAPPPPSRKGLKKPSNVTPTPLTGSILPTSLPSSLKRSSPPPRDSPTEKKPKIDMNSVPLASEKPGAIKLIPPKKIQTLVETNLFSDALSAATGPKKVAKRKRANTPAPTVPGAANATTAGKEGPSPPNSPEVPKVAPLKFYQDTLDESKSEDSKSDKENEDQDQTEASNSNKSTNDEDPSTDKDNDDDDDDIPLKKVKEDIDQKVAQEKKTDLESGNVIDITKDDDGTKEESNKPKSDSLNDEASSDTTSDVAEVRKPGPGCGPNGPPGVLMLHRRKGPKKKLTWRPQESLEQIRFFELDENERCNVTKTSFMDMKNLERFNERDAIVLARRGFNQEDNMEPQTNWKPLIEVDDVPPHPEGNQSKQRKIQAEREMTTLRALYFTQALIPDSPAEAEIEPIFNHDIPLIPLDDLTGNPDAVNDFTSMPWPEPRGSPKDGDNCSMAGTGGLGSPVDMFGGPKIPPMAAAMPNNGGGMGGYGANPFSPVVVNPFSPNQNQTPNIPPMNAMQNSPQGGGPWQRNGMSGNSPMMGNPFNNNHGSPIMDMGGPPRSMGGNGHGHMMNNGPQQNFNNQFGPGNNNNPFVGPGPMNPFVGPGPQGNNFGGMGPGGPMVPPHMMNGMGPGHMMGNGPNMMNGPNNRNNGGGGNWRTNGGSNFPDNNGGGNGGGNWRPAGSGPNNNRGGNGGGGRDNGNNGICKAFMRGHCRLGKSCKFIHPSKGKRI